MTEKRYYTHKHLLQENKVHDKTCHNFMNITETVEHMNNQYWKYKQLKEEYQKLKHRHSLLHDECLDAECERDSLKKDVKSLEKENEQLKQQLFYDNDDVLNELATKCSKLEKENEELKKILYDTVSQLDAEISPDYSVYSVRVVVDSVMFHRIKEICR